jgi:hypothetical protein
MGHPPTKGRRIVPPPVFVSAAPPPQQQAAPAQVAAPRKRRKRWPVALILSIVVGLLIVGGGAHIYKESARKSAVDRLRNGIKLAHTDSLKAATWLGDLRTGDTYYNLMTLREDDPFVKNFLDGLTTKANVLALLTHNRDGAPHRIELSGATLRFADGSERPALDSAAVLASATSDRGAAMAAFPGTVSVPPGEQVWGNLLFIPPDADITRLIAVTIKVDGRDGIVTGSFMTAEQKELAAVEAMRHKIEAAATTAPTTTNQ